MTTNAEVILEFLEQHPTRTFNRKEICLHTRLPYNTTGSTLRRMLKSNLILNPVRGYYQHPSGLVKPKLYPFFGLHGLKFESRCYKQVGWSFRRLVNYVAVRFPLREPKPHRFNKSYSVWGDWRNRNITLTIHPETTKDGDLKELIEIWCKSGQLPLSPLDFIAYCNWIVGVFGIKAELWILKERGINIDVPKTTISGSSDITMEIAQQAVMRMYQKGPDARFEIHDTREITGSQAIKFMKYVLEVSEAMG
jgi:hypothetical protein